MNTIKKMVTLLATIAGGYLLLLIFMYLFQSKLIFLPSSDLLVTPSEAALQAEDVWIETSDAERLHGWFFPNDSTEYIVVLSHGNAGNISNRIDIAKFLQEAGVSVLIYDYRGYGQSSGNPSEEGLYRDIEAVVNFLKMDKGYSEQQMIMYGRSMGGAVASFAATRFNVGGLVLDSAFKNVKAMVSDLYPFVPSFLASYKFPTEQYVQQLSGIPVMIMHSPTDTIVDISHGIALFGAANDPKTFVELRGGHNDNFHASVDIHSQNWKEFLRIVNEKQTRVTPD
ncbi:MAG: alpha/beta fold hydrolase [Balneolaceae bacterium]|nr:alpha/beta fold hydrolase [Balneolaceae bacterium]MDR9409785.1 alpha/beta fold hydrolase [Balneolaceae bacterium]